MTKEERLQRDIDRLAQMKSHEDELRQQGYEYIAGIDEVGRGPLAGPVYAACVLLPPDFDVLGIYDSKKLSAKKREELSAVIKEKAVACGIGIADNREIDEINILEATKLAMARAFEECNRKLKNFITAPNANQTSNRDEINIKEILDRSDSKNNEIIGPSINSDNGDNSINGNVIGSKTGGVNAVKSDETEKTIDYLLVDALKLELGVPCEGIVKGDEKSLSIAAASIVAKVARDKYMEEMDTEYPGYDFASNKGYGTAGHYEGLRSIGISPIHRRTFLKKFEQNPNTKHGDKNRENKNNTQSCIAHEDRRIGDDNENGSGNETGVEFTTSTLTTAVTLTNTPILTPTPTSPTITATTTASATSPSSCENSEIKPMSKKVYAVKKGRTTGLFMSWEDCKAQVDGFAGAEYKSFADPHDAMAYLGLAVGNVSADTKERKGTSEKISAGARDAQVIGGKNDKGADVAKNGTSGVKDSDGKKIVDEVLPPGNRAYVDGSYDSTSNRFSCGVVIIETDANGVSETTELKAVFEDDVAALQRNVAGEVMGAKTAIDYCLENGIDEIEIYHDYEGVGKWADGLWKANNPLTQGYKQYIADARRLMSIRFVKVKAHAGNKYNEMADKLAKAALDL